MKTYHSKGKRTIASSKSLRLLLPPLLWQMDMVSSHNEHSYFTRAHHRLAHQNIQPNPSLEGQKRAGKKGR
jgi:hypothetical protein